MRILAGTQIGDGAVIAAYSVVTKSVDPYTVVGGVPAAPIRERCSRDESDALRRIAWWDWPDEVIRGRADDLTGSVAEFIARYDDPHLAAPA